MRQLPYALLTALVLAAPTVPAHAAARPADVTASQCIAGGGMIIISAVGNGSESYTKRCEGGIHDGQTVV
ncbi:MULTISPECIES: hypothetical protein [unclassified Streptomyces]|uniref:hypothetical protein n=1 Tax=unclassified Streptomyces TaxID=2593676 RepID=UPI000DEF26DD|nr:hypothetical protein [Streptomyces sp. Go-475]AXE83437.1 hypothetical protein C1703_00425 [Streptomyces sp. Go-475]